MSGGGQLERISSGIYIRIYSRCVLVFLAMITSHNLQSLIRLYANLGIINNFKFASGGGQLDRISSEIYIEISSTCVLVVLAMLTSH